MNRNFVIAGIAAALVALALAGPASAQMNASSIMSFSDQVDNRTHVLQILMGGALLATVAEDGTAFFDWSAIEKAAARYPDYDAVAAMAKMLLAARESGR